MRHGSVTSTRRRLGGAALGLGGVAFAVIQILEQTIGAFDPRPIVAGLIAVTIGFAGLALERGRHVAATSRVLRGLLRVWPLRRVGDTDPLALGVFPPADAARGAALGPYVARDADPAVREALLAGGLVVVVGPDRAGKSRTAAEVARAGLGDRFVVLPVSGGALAALLADPSFTPPPDAVWWLDDLERFSGQLDASELDVLLDGRRVLATVRPQAWAQLLRASGDDGERGRRLAAAARVITVPAAASPAEAQRAREIHPDLDLGAAAVLGEALAAHSAPAPAAPAPGTPGGSRARARTHARPGADPRARRDGRVGGRARARHPHRRLGRRAAPADQRPARRDPPGRPARGRHRPARARGRAARDRRALAPVRPDAEGDRLRRAADLRRARRPAATRPRLSPEDAGRRRELRDRPAAGAAARRLGLLRRPPVEADLDGDGRSELVATYGLTTSNGPIAVPVVVGWDDESQRYAISPLLPGDQPVRAGVPPGAAVDPYFTGAYVLTDPRTGARLRAGAAVAYRVVAGGRVVVARTVDAPGAPRLAITVYAISMSRGRAAATLACGGGEDGIVRLVARGRRGADQVLDQVGSRFAREAVGGAPPDGSSCVI